MNMNFNYCVLAILLASSISHAMENTLFPSPESKPAQDSQPTALEGKSSFQLAAQRKRTASHKHDSSKDNAPVPIHITAFQQQISFNGQNKSLFAWLSKPQGPFGKTPILAVDTNGMVSNAGCVNHTTVAKIIMERLIAQQGLYIAHTHKHRDKDNKPISYGTLVVAAGTIDSKRPESIVAISNLALGHILLEKVQNQKPSTPRKKDLQDKGKEEETKA
jgi:hypothetical protein